MNVDSDPTPPHGISRPDGEVELNNEEFGCLVMRECNTRDWSLGAAHASVCRFCQGILHSARELREANLMIADDGTLIPRTA